MEARSSTSPRGRAQRDHVVDAGFEEAAGCAGVLGIQNQRRSRAATPQAYSGGYIIEDDAPPREGFRVDARERVGDVEEAKEMRAMRAWRSRRAARRRWLAGNFVDDDELRVFAAGVAGDDGGGGAAALGFHRTPSLCSSPRVIASPSSRVRSTIVARHSGAKTSFVVIDELRPGIASRLPLRLSARLMPLSLFDITTFSARQLESLPEGWGIVFDDCSRRPVCLGE